MCIYVFMSMYTCMYIHVEKSAEFQAWWREALSSTDGYEHLVPRPPIQPSALRMKNLVLLGEYFGAEVRCEEVLFSQAAFLQFCCRFFLSGFSVAYCTFNPESHACEARPSAAVSSGMARRSLSSSRCEDAAYGSGAVIWVA